MSDLRSDVTRTLCAVLEATAAEFQRAMDEASADVHELAAKLQKELTAKQRAVDAAVRSAIRSVNK